MAFPTVAATNGGGNNNPASNIHTVNLPASIAINDLLVVFFYTSGVGVTATTPSGWTSLSSNTMSGSGSGYVFYKTASGAEGASVSITCSGDNDSSYQSYRMTTNGGTWAINAVNVHDEGNATPDPISLTSGFGTVDTLWFVATYTSSAKTVSAYPTNYTVNGRYDTTGDAGSAASYRTARAASENPGAFTLSGVINVVAFTVGVYSPVAFTITETVTGSETSTSTRGAVFSKIDTTTLSEVVSAAKGKVFTILDTITGTDLFSSLYRWVRGTKSTTSFSGGTKNSASWSNGTKDATTFTNSTKS